MENINLDSIINFVAEFIKALIALVEKTGSDVPFTGEDVDNFFAKVSETVEKLG